MGQTSDRAAYEGTSVQRAERRVHPRVHTAVAVGMTSRSNFYTGLTENFSESGLFVATDEALPVGSRVDLTVDLGDGLPPLSIKGEVRWIRRVVPGGVGVRFEDVGPLERQRIQSFLSRRSPLFYEE
ncbi:MAG TPA: TIGR02266 family protein [Polyangiaceae bacterium]|jgi:uncharacterized protein (TIGR02266 family)